ncbi:response regulator [Clostridium grantii]|uniref:Stage 0 sporulation protein A homolog n=1 Tax=Clostridium grantii DSM 8605 TaxID=1121316 RepID=A0A1M5VTV9_9CLOT|nr:response regulator [Clostridium grantii]SHH78719.1 two-component system, response regulator YesN [Clostridium grantii DSM 8605]
MYTLMLVDDEEIVRKSILKNIQWEEQGFEVIGEAENGKEALDLVERNIPDLLITDIKMPFLDGIGLATELRKKYPTIKIVFLTGHDEFQYAKEAISLDIFEYILKPTSASDLIEILSKIKTKLDKETSEKEDIELLREHYTKSLPVLKENFLNSLIFNNLSKEEIVQRSEYYNIDIMGNGYCISLIDLEKKENTYSSNLSFEQWEHIELTRFAQMSTIEGIIKKYNIGLVLTNNNKIIVITIAKESKKESSLIKTFNCLEEIRIYIEKFSKYKATIGVGTFVTDISSLNLSYNSAMSALNYRILLGDNRIIFIEDIEAKKDEEIVQDDTKVKDLVTAIKFETEKEINNHIESIFDKFINSNVTIKDYEIFFLDIVTSILKTAKESNVDIDTIFGKNSNLFIQLQNLKNVNQIKAWLKDICFKIKDSIVKEREEGYKLLVIKSLDYIDNNYHNKDVSINKVCQYLHISSAYFSYIFKKETNLTFVNYLTNKRMEKAKELLKSTDLKSYEIAEKVGYAESNYFSYSFKKLYGKSPTGYRNG